MKSKKKVLIITISVLVIILALVLIFIFNKKSSNDQFFDYPESERKSIENCKAEGCDIWNTDNYDKLVLDKKYDVLKEKIDKINNDTEKYYQMVKKSNTNSDSCSKVKDMYNHRKRVVSHYTNYENKKYLSISVGRIIYDLCEDTIEPKQEETYIYDKKSKKILSQEEFKAKENISDKEIYNAIKKMVKIIKDDVPEGIKLQEKYDDTMLLYGTEGDICVSFYVKEANAYYTGTVRENKDSNQ